MNTDRVSALEKLVQLKADGTITPAEFEAEKAKLMAGDSRTPPAPPPVFFRRLWFVVTLTCLLVTFWLALFILASGPVYRKKAGVWSPISDGARRIYAGLLLLWILALLAKAIFHPGDWEVQTPAQETSSATQPVAAPTQIAQAATSSTQPPQSPQDQQTASAAPATEDQTASSTTAETRNPALPGCNSDAVRLMIIQGYIQHYNVPIGEIPVGFVDAISDLTEDTSPAAMNARRRAVDQGLAKDIGDVIACQPSPPGTSAMNGLFFITTAGNQAAHLGGMWFDTHEAFPLSE